MQNQDFYDRINKLEAGLFELRAELERIAASLNSLNQIHKPAKPIARTIQDGMNTIPRTACLLNPRPEDDLQEKKEST